MNKCTQCGSEDLISITAKCSDACWVERGGVASEGYVNRELGIGSGDYIRFTYCFTCKKIQDKHE